MNELTEGVRLKSVICLPCDGGQTMYEVDSGSESKFNIDCESIVVAEQAGQMASVPWAKVATRDYGTQLLNLANVEAVVLEGDNE